MGIEDIEIEFTAELSWHDLSAMNRAIAHKSPEEIEADPLLLAIWKLMDQRPAGNMALDGDY